MAATRMTYSVFRPDNGGNDGRGSWKHCSRMGVKTGGRRANGSPAIKVGSGAARCSGPGKFLLVGAVLAIQFIGAAAISSKGE